MFSVKNRRDFLKILAAGGAGLSLAQRSAAASLTAAKLTDNIALVTGAGSNVVLVNGPDGVLMVDAGSPEHSTDLLSFVGDHSGGRVQALFNTHWHLEHTGANEAIGKSGATIIAHENTKLWMSAEIIVAWQKNRVYR